MSDPAAEFPRLGAQERELLLVCARTTLTDSQAERVDQLVEQRLEWGALVWHARLHSVVRRQAVTDELTDLANRRRFMEVLQQEVARATRFGSALALALCDLDNFKQINDRCGHQAGDDVLRATANVIRERVRETDLPARIGGEEFAVILSGTDIRGAYALAEQLRHDLSARVRVPLADWAVTASFGIAMLHAGRIVWHGPTEEIIRDVPYGAASDARAKGGTASVRTKRNRQPRREAPCGRASRRRIARPRAPAAPRPERGRRSSRGRRSAVALGRIGGHPRGDPAPRRGGGSPPGSEGRTRRRADARARHAPRSGARSPHEFPRELSC